MIMMMMTCKILRWAINAVYFHWEINLYRILGSGSGLRSRTMAGFGKDEVRSGVKLSVPRVPRD